MRAQQNIEAATDLHSIFRNTDSWNILTVTVLAGWSAAYEAVEVQ